MSLRPSMPTSVGSLHDRQAHLLDEMFNGYYFFWLRARDKLNILVMLSFTMSCQVSTPYMLHNRRLDTNETLCNDLLRKHKVFSIILYMENIVIYKSQNTDSHNIYRWFTSFLLQTMKSRRLLNITQKVIVRSKGRTQVF